MVAVQQDFRVAVWTYTFTSGPKAGELFFHSPQSPWNNEGNSIILRQVNSKDANQAWVCKDKTTVTKVGDKRAYPTTSDAQGVIVEDGFGTVLNPSCGHSKNDGAPLVPYSRGERIWVQKDFTQNSDDLVPVISLDTFQAFTIPSEDICWTPQLVGALKNGNQVFAIPVGPRRASVDSKGIHYSQAYFQWPLGQPQMAMCRWDKWRAGDANARRRLSGFQAINDIEVRRNIFRQHWVLYRAKLGAQFPDDGESDSSTVLNGESRYENFHAFANSINSSSNNNNNNNLNNANKKQPCRQISNQYHRRFVNNRTCNLEPHCNLQDLQVEAAFGVEADIQDVSHYHVQHSDLECCAAGSRHQQHCVLYGDKRRCVFAGRHEHHVCCVPLSAVLGPDLQDKIAQRPKYQFVDYEGNPTKRTNLARTPAEIEAVSNKQDTLRKTCIEQPTHMDYPAIYYSAENQKTNGSQLVQAMHQSGTYQSPISNPDMNSSLLSTSEHSSSSLKSTIDEDYEMVHKDGHMPPPPFPATPLVINLRFQIDPSMMQYGVTPANTPSCSACASASCD